MIRPLVLLGIVLFASLAFAPGLVVQRVEAASAFFIVNDTGDAPDANTADGLCKTAANVCTLRAAIEQANANGNPADTDTITFSNGATGVGTVVNIRPLTPLPDITESVTISGQNTAGASCDSPRVLLVSIEPGAAMPGGVGLKAVNTTLVSILGVQIGGFAGAGVVFSGGTANVIYCSNIGTDLAGTTARPNGIGVAIVDSDQSQVGFSTVPLSMVISGNTVGVSVDGGDTTTIQSSRIGVAVDGTTPLPNTSHGVRVRNSSLTNIGRDSANGANVISSNGGNGVLLEADADSLTSVFVEHNLIGYALDGTTLRPNGANGINIIADNTGTVSTVRIGDLGVNDANKIYASGNFSAVAVREVDEPSQISKVRLLGSSLFSETGLAFNLRPFDEGPSLVTPNDGPELDADVGPNTLLNFPTLISATSELFPKIDFNYRSAPDISLSLHFYAVDACGAPGNRVMQRGLGSTAYTTDTNGEISGPTGVSGALAVGEGVVAVVVDEDGNTSEISNCVTATLPPPQLGGFEPRTVVAGQGGFTLAVESSYGPFDPGAKLTWDGEELPTTFVDDLHLTALVSAEQVGDTARIVQVGATGAEARAYRIARSTADINCSDAATAADALLVMNILAGLASNLMLPCSVDGFPIGDANLSGSTNLADAVYIRHEIAGLGDPLSADPQESD